MTTNATYLGANGWLIELNETRILIDPWLNGDLTFPPGDWLIKGELIKEIEVPENIDYLILTQGQPDHTHQPTLRKINKNINVIASVAASKVLKGMGFTKINTLKPDEIFKNKNLNIQATSGASVPNIENGYILEAESGSIYIEPHGFIDKKLKPRNIDLLITPVIDFSLPLAGNFINGKTVLPQLLKLFNPSFVLASTTGGDIKFTGIINNFIKVDGSVEDISLFNNIATSFINPVPLRKYEFDFTKKASRD